MKEIEVDYYCPCCDVESNVTVCIDGPTEYYIFDEYCPNCDSPIDAGNAEELAQTAVTDYYATQADFFYDDMRDRNVGV